MTRHFLDLDQIAPAILRQIINEGIRLKADPAIAATALTGKNLAMIFENPSTRTRISFDVGMRALGGETIMLTAGEMQLGRGETIADTARVMSRYVDAIMIRTPDPRTIWGLADNGTIPVINGLTRESHPCQVMADVMTFVERRGDIAGAQVAWVGASNNVLTSWLHAAAAFGFAMRVATPAAFGPEQALIDQVRQNGGAVELFDDAREAARGVDCVVTDTWVSMGDSDEDLRRQTLQPFQVNEALMAETAPGSLFMHCLPAHRGEEVVDAVIDGGHSVVWDEAENRLHVQKGILLWCLEKELG